jgi:Putative Flp pilus-assembly TadE/G-like
MQQSNTISGSTRLMVLSKQLHRLRADEGGAVSVMMGFLLIPLVGALGIGFEVSNWYMAARGMQNAADAAALAAATNAGSNYNVEAKAVAAQYGFVDGVNNISVAVSPPPGNTLLVCPDGSTNCYSVTISGKVPLLLSQVVGYTGDATLNGAAAKQLSSTAVAHSVPTDFCLVALGPQGIRANGASKSNMACNTMSNTATTCNGGNTGAPIGAAHGTNKGCGVNSYSNVAAIVDPYAGLASNIPANPCSSYPQEPTHTHDPALPTGNQLSGFQSLSGNNILCGDIQLTGNVTINAPAGAVLVIENGQLDTNGFTISTTSGSGLTVVFSGTTSGSYTHAPTGGGTLDIAAPTTGPWKGVAIYQDPKLTSGVDISAAGSTPAWAITGLVYLPNSSVTLSGAVNKAAFGKSCFAMVVKDITINGTGMISPNGECIPAGLGMPSTYLGRASLVS